MGAAYAPVKSERPQINVAVFLWPCANLIYRSVSGVADVEFINALKATQLFYQSGLSVFQEFKVG